MKNRPSIPHAAPLWLAGLSLLAGSSAPLHSEPKLGDVFREFTFNSGKPKSIHFSELDPNCPRKENPSFGMRTMKPAVPRAIVLELERAVRAELSVEYWGGHIGTSKQQFSVNSNARVDLPQPEGTPGNPVCYQRTLLGNNAVPIPLKSITLALTSWTSCK